MNKKYSWLSSEILIQIKTGGKSLPLPVFCILIEDLVQRFATDFAPIESLQEYVFDGVKQGKFHTEELVSAIFLSRKFRRKNNDTRYVVWLTSESTTFIFLWNTQGRKVEGSRSVDFIDSWTWVAYILSIQNRWKILLTGVRFNIWM